MSEEIHFCTEYALPPEMEEDAAKKAVEENPDNAPEPAEAPVPGLELASVTAKRWRKGRTLDIHFMGGDSFVRSKVVRYASKWQDYVHLNFNFCASLEEAQIRIAFDRGGSWSYIGTDALSISRGRPTMNFGWFKSKTPDREFSRTTIHEFGHMLSFIHEHQNPAVDIPWDKPAVYRHYEGPPNNWSKAQVDNNLFRKYSAETTNHSTFDRDSIMLYAIPNNLTVGDYEVGWNRELSELDKSSAAEWYPRT